MGGRSVRFNEEEASSTTGLLDVNQADSGNHDLRRRRYSFCPTLFTKLITY